MIEDEATSLDTILGGRLRLRQKRDGHRVGLDATLLAAAAGAPAKHLIDVGAGVGAVGLALLQRWPEANAQLVEIDPTLAGLADDNAALNGLSARARIVVADVLAPRSRRAAGLADEAADLVVTNPPYLAGDAARVSPDPLRARAHIAGANATALTEWVVACLALLAPGGRFVMIQRADALPSLLPGFASRLGDLALRPVHPRADAPAIRLLISGVKGSKAPLRLLPGLVLHENDGAPTALAAAIQNGEATL
ncbi:MAG: methyltransferase [Bradyrhizobium sp.]|nr:MAG: methyltransferase [Bradyrhizobium sp.]